MIQRIQTLYLALAGAAMSLTLFGRVATFFAGEEGRLATLDLWPIAILAGLTTLLLLSNIFLYRNRWLQLRLCFSALVLALGLQVFVAYYIVRLASDPAITSWKPGLATILPIIAFVFTILAIRGIVHDQRLIKSLDRLR